MKNNKYTIFLCFTLTLLFQVSCKQDSLPKHFDMKQPVIQYITTDKDSTVDDYFGTKVPDPYRWLENDTTAKVKSWVTAQNNITNAYLAQIPFREKIRKYISGIINYPRYGSPFRAGEYYFFSKNDGLQNQSVIYFQKGLEGKPEVFLDPNTMSADGTASASLTGFSPDFKYVAISINESGSDWHKIKVMEVATKRELPDVLSWVKFSGASWRNDGFYYSRYDAPAKGQELSAKNEFHKVYYHKLGEPQEKDELIYEDKKVANRYYSASLTEDRRFLFIYISAGTHGTEIMYKDLSNPAQKEFQLLCKGFEFDYGVIDNIGDKLLVSTNDGAPNWRVVEIDSKNPAHENWKNFIPEKNELLESATTAGGKLYCTYLKDVSTKAFQYDMTGKQEHEIVLPGLGNASGFGGYHDDKVSFYTFTSFTYPATIFKYDIASGKSEVWHKPEVKFNPDDYETHQVFFSSKDGTRVPMFLVYKKGIPMDGKRPTLLYGYGGFNISLTPSFSVSRLTLLDNGGVYAVVNLRGGGEYGEKWHQAGMLEHKQNVFDDFIAAAEYLESEKYTSRDFLAIQGGSNGGLLVGACMTQRPDLFKVCIPEVGVMDMLRYHKFTVGWGWAVEYGSSDSLKHFQNLYKYSPLHNIRPGIDYPATLVMTADHDDRVVPAHSFKFIATLQEKSAKKNPALIRIDTKAGHGGSSLSKFIDVATDMWSFVFFNMGITPKD